MNASSNTLFQVLSHVANTSTLLESKTKAEKQVEQFRKEVEMINSKLVLMEELLTCAETMRTFIKQISKVITSLLTSVNIS